MADEIEEVLTEEQQEEADALLAVNGDIKGELKANRPLDEDAPQEGAEDDTEADDTGGDGEESAVETGEDAEEPADSGTDEEAEVAEVEEVEELTPEVDETGVYEEPTIQDPGDFQPGDYSFEVKLTDGKTMDIKTPEDSEALAARLDQDPELMSASQFLQLAKKTALMESGIATDRRVYDELKTQAEAQAQQTETRESYLNQWQGEINYLREKGNLPVISPELNNADWTDPKIASQPAVKETLALFKWMEQENDQRMEAGLNPDLSVLSAFKSRQLELNETEAKDEAKAGKDLTRTRGSMVGGKAPYSPDYGQKKGTLVGAPKGLDELAAEAYYAEQQ